MCVSTRRNPSRSREASDLPPRELPSRRLCRENADSTAHRWPYTRFDRDPSGLGRNRRVIWPRYRPRGGPPWPRVFTGMTDERMPRLSRAKRWWASESNAASASTRSQRTARAANVITGVNCGESLVGPTVTVAPARKWLAVSQATVSLVYVRAACSRPDRATKYRDVWRLSRPVASTAAVGVSPIRPRATADVVARARRPTMAPLLAAAWRRSTGSSSAAPWPTRGRTAGRPSRSGTG